MPRYVIKKQPGWHFKTLKTNARVQEISGILGNTKLSHKDIPGDVGFYPKGLKHIVGTHDTRELELLMRAPAILKDVFSNGKCQAEPVHADKKGYADKCWHVVRTSKINGKTCRMEFVVLHHLALGRNVLYDAIAR